MATQALAFFSAGLVGVGGGVIAGHRGHVVVSVGDEDVVGNAPNLPAASNPRKCEDVPLQSGRICAVPLGDHEVKSLGIPIKSAHLRIHQWLFNFLSSLLLSINKKMK